MIKIKVSSKGQVVIPVEVRARYGIDTGTELELREGPGYLTLHPLPADPIGAARGLLRPPQESRSLVRELLRDKQALHARDRNRPRTARTLQDQQQRPLASPSLQQTVLPTLFDPSDHLTAR